MSRHVNSRREQPERRAELRASERELRAEEAQRRTADLLRQSEEHFRSIAESGAVAIAFFELEGAITDANDE